MGSEAVAVAWEIAHDERFTQPVQRGEAIAHAAAGHSVHVEVMGLAPERWYWYRFKVGNYVSPIGRTRTLPVASVMPSRLQIAVGSCQNFEQGLFTAYDHLIADAPDLVLFLGDYIYEYKGMDNKVRRHVGNECMSVIDYRNRYAQYRSDPALQRAHACAPWIVTPDDHEFDNNCAGLISEEANVDPAVYVARRAQAYQALYEHMPMRRSALPNGPNMQIYRRFSVGRLAQIDVCDTRQYRTDQPCGDGNKPPCPEAMNPQATLLGTQQRQWLFDGWSRSPATWNIVAQQVMIARVDRKSGEQQAYSMDQWPGYEVERRQVIKYLGDHKIANPVVLAGDIHSNWANDLSTDFDGAAGSIIASEFVGTSISSGGNGVAAPKFLGDLLSENPFVRFHNTQRGYLRLSLNAKQMVCDFRVVPFVDKPGAPIETAASYVVEAGKAGPQKA
jgi:alkaline phosphatase D